MKRQTLLFAVTAAFIATTAFASTDHAQIVEPRSDLAELIREVESVLPESWRVLEAGTDRLPIGWSGPAVGLYVMVEDMGTRFFHPNGFHYYSFYRVWLLPPEWEGTMRHTPYIADSTPAFLLGMNDRYVALYHTAGGNVWPDGPASLCTALELDTIRYTDLSRRVVDMEIEEQLTAAPAAENTPSFTLNPYRIVGLAGDGPGLYLEYLFGDGEQTEDEVLNDLTARLAGSVFEKFPDVESLYLRRCTRDTFTDTILNRD